MSLWSTWQSQHREIRTQLHAASRFSNDDIVTSLKCLCALCAQVNLPAKDKMVKPRCAVGQVRCLQACPITDLTICMVTVQNVGTLHHEADLAR